MLHNGDILSIKDFHNKYYLVNTIALILQLLLQNELTSFKDLHLVFNVVG